MRSVWTANWLTRSISPMFRQLLLDVERSAVNRKLLSTLHQQERVRAECCEGWMTRPRARRHAA